MSGTVTYSPAYTLVPTYECFNRCDYCNFRVDVGSRDWLSEGQVERVLRRLVGTGTREILILSGELHPKSQDRSRLMKYIYTISERSLDFGFLPHSNLGPLRWEEMKFLKEVNASMGLMLEQLSPRLLQTVHRRAPSKRPEVRLQQLEWAGKLKIPFTTGLLLGIGETERDWQDTLEAIARTHQRWGHIQEVILQPYSPGASERYAAPAFPGKMLLRAVAIARAILPASITLQIPPNLIAQPQVLLACLETGVRDLGGIVPKDEVNPSYSHLENSALANLLRSAGWKLVPRLPVYPQYYDWLPARLQTLIASFEADRV